MNVLAIDPGNVQSACVVYSGTVEAFGKLSNLSMLHHLKQRSWDCNHLATEYMQPRGMPTSKEEMDTQFWTGRFVQAAGLPWTPVLRREVKSHLCGSQRAKDSNIRRALIDKFGGDNVAIGGVKCPKCKGKGWAGRGRPTCLECNGSKWLHPPGPLHGISADVWSALAIAVTWWETKRLEANE